MKAKMFQSAAVAAVIALIAANANAAFLVEAHSSGLASDHFSVNWSGTPSASTASTAFGVTATNSVWGGAAAPAGEEPFDTYTYSYTPGTDADNLTIPTGTDLGLGVLASGLTGGGTGLYNVYITVGTSNNISALCDIITTNDGADVVLAGVDMDGTGAKEWDQSDDTVMYDGMNVWKLIASNVHLTAGNTYTVSQVANYNSYVSMRSHGVLFEAVPEPATLMLLGLGGLLLRRRR